MKGDEKNHLTSSQKQRLSRLADFDDLGLVQEWALVMRELRSRGLVRSGNQPVADLAERAAADALDLQLEAKSNRGYDAVDQRGMRYEVKSRRVTPWNGSRQLSPLRDLPDEHFDVLVAVIYDEMLDTREIWAVPHRHVLEVAKYRSHVRGWIVHASGALLEPPARRVE